MIMHGKNDFLEMLLQGEGMSDLLTSDGEVHSLAQADRVVETEPNSLDFFEIPTGLLDNMFSGDQMLDELTSSAPADLNYTEELYTTGNEYCLQEDSTSSSAPANLIPTTVDFQILNTTDAIITEQDFLGNHDDIVTTVACDDMETSNEFGSISEIASEMTIESENSNPFSPDLTEHEVETRIASKVKEELRTCIRIRRLTEGKELPKVEFKEPEPEQLTEEEEERRRMRREKNKLAAQKCRNKKRETAEYLEGEIRKMEMKNQAIKLDLKKLIKERDELRDTVSVHREVCPRLRITSANF
ncbi:hypothetical protein CHS0354_037540 [Potamilus streckersoni]|uniref:BZIP domain-containing protein n=1 Tax=Potamilus streckersoni TaxID=2493646 RepID=A0AAE0TA81_9BIVA|nr:hypothetical protein CHS0354_037540 [Potamilus streckersoni]